MKAKASAKRTPAPQTFTADFGPHLTIRRAVFHLLEKLHAESNEDGGTHWPECDALVEAMGWESWDAWRAWERQRVEAEP